MRRRIGIGLDARHRAAAAALAILLGAWVGSPSPTAQSEPPTRAARAGRMDPQILDFVYGNVEFLLLHELAHFLIAEKQIPIIGPEENAADYLAAIALIRTEPFDPEHENQTLDFLFAAANAFAASWKLGSAIGSEIPYWGNHALSIQRYYQIACLLFGSDPETFSDVPATAGLPEIRATSCAAEFEQANRSVQWLLDNFGRSPDDPSGASIEIVYEQPKTRVVANLLERIRASRLFETTVERLHELFFLERPFVLAVRNCGMPEAAWVPEQRELVVCNELIETIYLLGLLER